MNLTNQLGELTELLCRVDFCKRGIVLSQPTNPSSRYDFIADINGRLLRIQCKTAHPETSNIISISVSSKNWNSGERHNYINAIDYFYTNWNNQGYLIPISVCSETNRTKHIRLGKKEEYTSHNNALYGENFLIDAVLEFEAPDFKYEIISIENADRSIVQTSNPKYFCPDCGKPVRNSGARCRECYYKTIHPMDIPSKEQLKGMIRNMPFTEIAKKYNRTDNTIRKWCDKYNLPRRKIDIEKFSDNDWLKL